MKLLEEVLTCQQCIVSVIGDHAGEGVDAIFQFMLTGDNGANYWIRVNGPKIDVHEGEANDPNITITASANDYMALVNGKLNAMSAFMQGKIKVKGDMGLALKLQSMFGLM